MCIPDNARRPRSRTSDVSRDEFEATHHLNLESPSSSARARHRNDLYNRERFSQLAELRVDSSKHHASAGTPKHAPQRLIANTFCQ